MTILEIKQLLGKILKWPWEAPWSCNNSWDIYETKIPYKNTYVFIKNEAEFIAISPEIVSELVQKLEKAKAALEFYANENNYECSCTESDGTSSDHDCCVTTLIKSDKAREVLKELGE